MFAGRQVLATVIATGGALSFASAKIEELRLKTRVFVELCGKLC